MSKFRERVSRAWTNVRDGFRRFIPFHVGALALAICGILEIHNSLSGHTFENIARGLCWGMLAGVSARLASDKCKGRYSALISWGVTLVVTALGISFWFNITKDSSYYWIWTMLYGGTTYSLVAACMAMLYEKENEHALFSQIIFKLIIVFVSVGIVNLGLMGCLFAFDSLITSINHRLYGDVSMIVMAAAGPIIFMSSLPRPDSDDEDSQRAGAFLFRLILPLALVLLAVLYLYLAKILVRWSMPAGKLNWFGSIALAVYIFFWLALGGSDRKFTRFVIRRGWALLVPVVIAQIIAVVVRYNAYGLTAERMAGMILLALGVYALVLAAFDSRRIWFFVVMAVVGLVFTVTPLNFMDVPVRNQEHRLRAALERIGCFSDGNLAIPEDVSVTDNEAKVIVGAWDYLNRAHTEWHKADFKENIRQSVKTTLLEDLGIDRSKVEESSRRSSQAYGGHARYAKFKPNGKIPIEGCTTVRPIDRYRATISHKPEKGDRRWELSIPLGEDEKDTEKFDVTEYIKIIFVASGCTEKGLFAKDEYESHYTADPALFRWELKPGVELALGGFGVCVYNDADRSSVYVDSAVILYRDAEQ